MERHTAQTLATLCENLRLAREVRQGALERRNFDIVALEDERIVQLERHIAQIEATAERRQASQGGSEETSPAVIRRTAYR